MSQLDGLRTVAALGVMFYHLSGVFGPVNPFSRAYLFVDLFFMLSGFVLARSAEPRLAAGLTTALDFMRNRVRRLWPVVALAAVAGTLPYLGTGEIGPLIALMACGMLMLPVLRPETAIFPLNGPQWSLFWELAANLLHGCILHRLSDRALLVAVGAAGIAVIAAIRYAGCNCEGSHAELWWLAAPRVGWAYLLGVLLARSPAAGTAQPGIEWWAALLLPLAAVLVVPLLPLDKAGGDAVLSLVVLPLLFWLAVRTRPPRWAAPILERLGELSFPIYAFHTPIIAAFLMIQNSWASRVAAVIVTVLVAALLPRSIAGSGSKRPRRPPVFNAVS